MDPRELRLPPALRFRYRLRLTGPARFHFCHGGVLRGVVSAALGRHRLPPTVVPFAPDFLVLIGFALWGLARIAVRRVRSGWIIRRARRVAGAKAAAVESRA